MRHVPRALWISLACAVLVIGICTNRATAGPAEEWMPLEVGSEWVYESTTEGRMKMGEIEHTTELNGEIVVAVAGVLGDASDVRVVTTSIRNETTSGSSSRSLRTDHLGYSHGSLISYGNGMKQTGELVNADDFTEFDPPHVLLKQPLAPGTAWQVGIRRTGSGRSEGQREGQEIESAEALGREAVTTPAGRFEDCLKIVYRKAAAVNAAGSPAEGPAGGNAKEERIEWFARGLGIVKRVSRSQAQIRRPDGIEVSMTSTSTELLRRYQLARE